MNLKTMVLFVMFALPSLGFADGVDGESVVVCNTPPTTEGVEKVEVPFTFENGCQGYDPDTVSEWRFVKCNNLSATFVKTFIAPPTK